MRSASGVRVLRVYHGGRDPSHRARDRALAAEGIELTLVVPASWPGPGDEASLSSEAFEIVELPTRRAGDVNRHAPAAAVSDLVERIQPDVLDLHEEPFSSAAHAWLRAAGDVPVVMYTAQNVAKRYPPPFSRYEQQALQRVAGMYPCTRQAAAVARAKGFDGRVEVIPLGYDDALYRPGSQSADDSETVLVLAGRLVPEKGVQDAVRILSLLAGRNARLVLVGDGPEQEAARRLASELGVEDRLELVPWVSPADLAALFRDAHVALATSHPTETWTEQFGRVIVEAQASGAVVAGYASGSIPEVAGEAGLVVPTGDVSALAAAIGDALDDGAAFHDLRARGLAAAAQRTWSRVAAAQAQLYRAALTSAPAHGPGSPRRRRAAAAAEFGTPAGTLAGARPFALPLLRRGGTGARALGAILDAGAELRASIRQRRASSTAE